VLVFLDIAGAVAYLSSLFFLKDRMEKHVYRESFNWGGPYDSL